MAIRIKTSLSNFTHRALELEHLSSKWECTPAEVAREIVTTYYSNNSDDPDQMRKLLDTYPDDWMVELYCNS